MKTFDHFKKLFAIAKESGIEAALKHDAIETLKRHPVFTKKYILPALININTRCTLPEPDPEVAVLEPTGISDGKYELWKVRNIPRYAIHEATKASLKDAIQNGAKEYLKGEQK